MVQNNIGNVYLFMKIGIRFYKLCCFIMISSYNAYLSTFTVYSLLRLGNPK